jgi:hypothetical protein
MKKKSQSQGSADPLEITIEKNLTVAHIHGHDIPLHIHKHLMTVGSRTTRKLEVGLDKDGNVSLRFRP